MYLSRVKLKKMVKKSELNAQDMLKYINIDIYVNHIYRLANRISDCSFSYCYVASVIVSCGQALLLSTSERREEQNNRQLLVHVSH